MCQDTSLFLEQMPLVKYSYTLQSFWIFSVNITLYQQAEYTESSNHVEQFHKVTYNSVVKKWFVYNRSFSPGS